MTKKIPGRNKVHVCKKTWIEKHRQQETKTEWKEGKGLVQDLRSKPGACDHRIQVRDCVEVMCRGSKGF